MNETRTILTEYWKSQIEGDGLRDADWAFRSMMQTHNLTPPFDMNKLYGAYVRDIAFFFMHVLRIIPWINLAEPTRDQLGILEAVLRYDRIAVRSGHKVSKSNSLIGIALWWFCTRPQARIPLTSSSFPQVRQILWYELKQMYRTAAMNGMDIGGHLHEDPQMGLNMADGRQIFGFSTKEAERAAGISGKNVFYMPDEASGILELIFDALDGNLAGGGKMLMTSNPTRTSGYFYEAFTTKAEFWHRMHIPSTHTPNFQAGRIIVPGLATRAWADEKLKEWGRQSPLYQVRVEGDFPDQSAYAVFPLDLVESAAARGKVHTEVLLALETPIMGTLSVGVDPSGTGEDPWVIQGVIGQHMLPYDSAVIGQSALIAARVVRYVKKWKSRSAAGRSANVIVRIDAIGEGWATIQALNGEFRLQCRELKIIVKPVVVSEAAYKEVLYYDKRTEAAFTLKDWLEEGGCLLGDGKLHGELVGCEYDPFQKGGKFRLLAKKKEKELLRRSPNNRDALALATYRRGSYTIDHKTAGLRDSYTESAGHMGYG